jgi:hypothetical protein
VARQIIPFPQELRPKLPTIIGNVDYLMLRQRLEQIDALLLVGGVEKDFVLKSLQRWMTACKEEEPSSLQQIKYQQRSRRALRCTVLRTLLQEDYRGFTCQLAGNPLFQWFCQVDALEVVRVPSKSELHRFTTWLPAETMRQVINGLLKGAMNQSTLLELEEPLDLEEYFLDSTCVKANIHFPIDWVLLRDGVRTLMKATLLIREEGLNGRMEAPEEFLRRMNRLSIEMSQQGRRAESKKGRKQVLRKMKKLVGVVRAHAQRHRELLDRRWEETKWTRPQAEQILRRLDSVLELLPRAQEQAHERIIGGRLVANEEKILSLYDLDVRILVRGKAGAEVEFGNTVLVGENRQGLILDYSIFRESAPADSQLLMESLMRVWSMAGRQIGSVVTDRGFGSAANSKTLANSETLDATCPRKPEVLKERMQNETFARLQRRRGQTEARIAILKNGFLGRPLRAKGFDNREMALAWGVLTHNLWKLAEMRKTKDAVEPVPKAA